MALSFAAVPEFQSTLPLRRATSTLAQAEHRWDISIHAPLAESDSVSMPSMPRPQYFNPRSPCGERRPVDKLAPKQGGISIHAPLAESDSLHSCLPTSVCVKFQSTLPLRRATSGEWVAQQADVISIHAPLAESDVVEVGVGAGLGISIHAPLAESDQ